MKSCKDFFELEEALITFGGKSHPEFGQVIIQTGRTSSGKEFLQSKFIEGKIINVDDVKKWIGNSLQLVGLIKARTGVDIRYEELPLSDPNNISILHDIISNQMDITDEVDINLFKSIASSVPDRKPNLLFDVTLKDLDKLDRITRNIMPLGYAKENIHIVWILTPFEEAREQNMLIDEIQCTAMTFHHLIYSVDTNLSKYMNGDMWIEFSNSSIESELKKSDVDGSFIEKGAQCVKVKKQGQPIQIPDKDLASKIASYVPDTSSWKK